MEQHEIVIIGAGPAGLAAAYGAAKAGAKDILILDRDFRAGGILNQCIHNGFGLHTFKEELTGPEYAARYEDMVRERKIPLRLNTMVLEISPDKVITCVSRKEGLTQMRADAIILAMGCRERPRGALNIPGTRPAGIYTAGTAQRLVNIEGKCVGREIVILGSGDIGLIMARRMTLEGAKVKVVAELMPYSGGLKRNIVQCLNDYNIPLRLSHTVVKIEGKERVSGVVIAQVGPDRKPILGTEEYYSCDTLLLSCGLIPENELSRGAGVKIDRVTGGPVVNERLETSIPGVFACGNVLHVHDLVDYVSEEASLAGTNAAAYAAAGKDRAGQAGATVEAEKDRARQAGASAAEENRPGQAGASAAEEDRVRQSRASAAGSLSEQALSGTARPAEIPVLTGAGVRYTVPQKIAPGQMTGSVVLRFRVGDVYKNKAVCVYYGDTCVTRMKKKVLAPGEMEKVVLTKESFAGFEDIKAITVCLEEAQ